MRLPSLMHVPRDLSFEPGPRAGRRLLRALRHARTCPACGVELERLLFAQRALEGGSLSLPTALEEAALVEAGLPAALGAAVQARPARTRLWPALGLLAAGAAALALWVRNGAEDEWRPRGGAAAHAALRVFCAEPSGPLRELAAGDRCPVGARLAFAAGARPPLTHVAVVLRSAAGDAELGPFPVAGAPGAEAELAATPELSEAGPLSVEAGFGSDAGRARAALRGPGWLSWLRPGERPVARRLRIEVAR